MNSKKEWIKCSAVAVGFYLIVYILLAHFYFGFFHLRLIGILSLLAVGDVWGLHWWLSRNRESEHDDYP